MLAGTVRLHPRLQPARHRPADQGAPHLGAGVGAEDPRRAARAHPARGARSRRAAARQRALHAALVAVPPRASALRVEVLELRRRRRAARSRARGVLGPARLRRDPGLRPHRDRADRQPESPVQHQQGIGRQGDRRRRGEDRGRRRDPRARRQRHQRLFRRRRGDRRGVRRRLVPHRRHRRSRRAGPAVHQGPQEGDDRHARGAERLSRGRGARRGRRSPGVRDVAVVGVAERRRGARARRRRRSSPASIRRPSSGRPTSRCSTIRRFAASRSGRRASCRARRARAS